MQRFTLITILLFSSTILVQANTVKDSLLQLLNRANTDSARFEALINLSNQLEKKSNQESLHYAERAYALARKNEYSRGMGRAKLSVGAVYNNLGNYELALEKYKQAKKHFFKIADSTYFAKAVGNMGRMYALLGQHEKALTEHYKALSLYEQMDDKKGIGRTYVNIGNVYGYQRDYQQALSYWRDGLKIFKKQGDDHRVATCLNNIASAYYYTNQLDSAEYYFKVALDLREKGTDISDIGSSYLNLGSLYNSKGKYATGLQYLNKALAIHKKRGEKVDLAIVYHNMGNAYHNLKSYQEAGQYYQKALQLAKATKYLDLEQVTYQKLALNSAEINDYKDALLYAEKQEILKDSLLNKKKSRQVAELRSKYESQKKEKEIKLLQQNNKIKKMSVHQQKVWLYTAGGGGLGLILFLAVLYNRYRVKQKANILLNKRKKEIIQKNDKLESAFRQLEQKNRAITSSIEYASHIQDAILPTDQELKTIFSRYFVFYQPRDILGGDFYWVHATDDEQAIWSVADCTGHGVPGALMSMIGHVLLNEIIIEKQYIKPNKVLDILQKEIVGSLKQRKDDANPQDTIDISLCVWDKKRQQLHFAGANHPLYVVRTKGQPAIQDASDEIVRDGFIMYEILPDPRSIGIRPEHQKVFTTKTIKLEKGDRLYTFTDGGPDQLGGKKKEKIGYTQFKKLLLKTSSSLMKKQKEQLRDELRAWQHKEEQSDDILVMGVQV